MKRLLIFGLLLCLGTSCTLTKGSITTRSPLEFRDNRNLPEDAFVVIEHGTDYLHAFNIDVRNDTIYFDYAAPGLRQQRIARNLARNQFILNERDFNEKTLQRMVVVKAASLQIMANRKGSIYVDDILDVRMGEDIKRTNTLPYMIALGSVFLAGITWGYYFQIR